MINLENIDLSIVNLGLEHLHDWLAHQHHRVSLLSKINQEDLSVFTLSLPIILYLTTILSNFGVLLKYSTSKILKNGFSFVGLPVGFCTTKIIKSCLNAYKK